MRPPPKVSIWKSETGKSWQLSKATLPMALALEEIKKMPDPNIMLVSEYGGRIIKRRDGANL